jgi:16S rRNA (cytosine1402-N4)-methyltransferase
VLLGEIIEHLDLKAGDVVLDATLGGGGHAESILDKILPGGKLIGLDRDPEALERVQNELRDHKNTITYINEDFRNTGEIFRSLGIKSIDGAIFDLGMSSFQVDDEKRGFSFLKDGPLDMRFDRRKGLSAASVVNKFGREELAEIIKEYGEERHARLVAGAICSARKEKGIQTTGELRDIIAGVIGRKYARQRLHPAARTFQAIRIYVNDELGALKEAISATVPYLGPKARICIISFHSLEDRIVKNAFRDMKKAGVLNILTKKPIRPEEGEVRDNPRSRSAKLRVAEKAS